MCDVICWCGAKKLKGSYSAFECGALHLHGIRRENSRTINCFNRQIASLEAQVEDRDKAYGYLSRLFKVLAPQCDPLPDLLGLCTQIDNYTAGCNTLSQQREARLRASTEELLNFIMERATDKCMFLPEVPDDVCICFGHIIRRMAEKIRTDQPSDLCVVRREDLAWAFDFIANYARKDPHFINLDKAMFRAILPSLEPKP